MIDVVIKSDTKCPECGAKGEFDGTEVYCPDCGLVLQDYLLERGPSFYSKEDSDRLIEANPPSTNTMPLMGQGSQVGDGSYKNTKSRKEMQLVWAQKRTKQSFCSQSLQDSLVKFQRICEKLELPDYVQEGGAIILRKMYNEGMTRGREKKKIMTGLMILLCRQYDIIRTPDEIVETTGFGTGDHKKVLEALSSYKKLCDELDMKMQPFTCVDYTKRLCDTFRIYGEKREEAVKLAKRMEGRGGYSPRTVASAVLYITEDNLTQRELSEEMDVTSLAIRNRYKDIEERFDFDER